MMLFKLAIKNLLGAGLKTWLNVLVLSFAFIIIIFNNGLIDGWNKQARTDTKNWEVGSGQYWHDQYDPYDPFTLLDAHGTIPIEAERALIDKQLVPILVTQATVYPHGRMLPTLLKGIPEDQEILELPVGALGNSSEDIPAIIGKRMAESSKINKGDLVIVRWRDKNGTFDATEIKIVEIFDCNVPTVDTGQIWIGLDVLQQMTGLVDQATLLVVDENYRHAAFEQWTFKGIDTLLEELDMIIQSKKSSGWVLYGLLLTLALLAIFDTQVLSIFRRQKEIGTYVALGMTRAQVVGLFTLEGSANSLLAIMVAAIYGIPLLGFLATHGIAMYAASDDYGLSIAERIFPVYGAGLVLSTVAIVILTATIVSFIPSKKIAKMNPTDALKGKLQ